MRVAEDHSSRDDKDEREQRGPRAGRIVRAILIVAVGAVVVALSIFNISDFFRRDGELVFWAFDVGHGDSFLFRFPSGAHVLVDAGPKAGGDILVRKLRAVGATKIDVAIATHPHEDHIGAMERVVRELDVASIWTPPDVSDAPLQRSLAAAAADRGAEISTISAGDRFDVGAAEISVLAPRDGAFAFDANDSSIILYVVYGDMSFLLMSDAEGASREQVERFPRAVVLKLSHHGSRGGTDDRLLDECEPVAAILSAAEENPYGHPHDEVISMIEERGIEIVPTYGLDVVIESNGSTWSCERVDLRARR